MPTLPLSSLRTGCKVLEDKGVGLLGQGQTPVRGVPEGDDCARNDAILDETVYHQCEDEQACRPSA